MTEEPAMPSRGLTPALREVAVLTLACLAYSILSFLAPATPTIAFAHAHAVESFENSIGINIEPAMNAWLSARPTLAHIASLQYSLSFFAFTIGALIVLWFYAPRYYSRARWVLVLMTAGALITYWIYPLAPPRLVEGFATSDTVAQYTGLYSRLFGTLANPYGAMPSVHTGWAVWVASALGIYVWQRWWQRLLLALHPLATIITIIATANHYVVDAIAGIAYCAVAWLIILLINTHLPEKVRQNHTKS